MQAPLVIKRAATALIDRGVGVVGFAIEPGAGDVRLTLELGSGPDVVLMLRPYVDGGIGRTTSFEVAYVTEGEVQLLSQEVEAVVGWLLGALRREDDGEVSWDWELPTDEPDPELQELIETRAPSDYGNQELAQMAAWLVWELRQRPVPTTFGPARTWVLEHLAGFDIAEYVALFGDDPTELGGDWLRDLENLGWARRTEDRIELTVTDPARCAAAAVFVWPSELKERLFGSRDGFSRDVDWLARL
jgi:hypothetical protein